MIEYRPYGLVALTEELTRDEGYRMLPYQDSVDKTTIGIGHNLDDRGLTDEQIHDIFLGDVGMAEETLDRIWKPWRLLSENRQRVLLNMSFNLGETRLRGFRKMWAALEADDFDEAAVQMLDSKWAVQVGIRATRLADRMRAG